MRVDMCWGILACSISMNLRIFISETGGYDLSKEVVQNRKTIDFQACNSERSLAVKEDWRIVESSYSAEY